MQGCYSEVALLKYDDIAGSVSNFLGSSCADPVVCPVPRVFFYHNFRIVPFLSEFDHFDSLDRLWWDVDVERDSRRQFLLQETAGQFVYETGGKIEIKVPLFIRHQRYCQGGNLKESPLDGSGHSPGVGNILLPEIGAMIDTGDDQIWLSREDFLDGQVDAVGGSTACGIDVGFDFFNA